MQKPIPIDLAQFSAAQVAEIADTTIKVIATWTTRDFAGRRDPRVKRGGGVARRYSLRDALWFALAAQLHRRYHTPLPQLQAIARLTFGGAFTPERAAFVVVASARPGSASTHYCPDIAAVASQIQRLGCAIIVIDAREMFGRVMQGARLMLSEKERAA
jgi:hypothetical protein